jgi:hypothetical protein
MITVTYRAILAQYGCPSHRVRADRRLDAGWRDIGRRCRGPAKKGAER